MSANLIERIKKARQTTVKIGDITLICRRPTDLEMIELYGDEVTQRVILRKFVDGWEGMTELQLVPGGTANPVPFSHELYDEWIEDQPESWNVIIDTVMQGYKAHQDARKESAKN